MARRRARGRGLTEPAWTGREATEQPCSLCGRSFSRRQLSSHHCLPREKDGSPDDIEFLCAQCLGMVHATYTNATPAALYPTVARLRRAPELASYLVRVRKQPPSRRTKNKPRRRRL